MAASQLLPVTTACPENSVWRDVSLTDFRKNVDSLKRVAEIAQDNEIYVRRSTEDTRLLDAHYALPFEIEKTFVNHLAFVAAVEKAAVRVTAVSLEEGSDSVTVRLVSNDPVLPAVEKTFRDILNLLSGCAKRSAYIAVPSQRYKIHSCLSRDTCQRMPGADLWARNNSEPATHTRSTSI